MRKVKVTRKRTLFGIPRDKRGVLGYSAQEWFTNVWNLFDNIMLSALLSEVDQERGGGRSSRVRAALGL